MAGAPVVLAAQVTERFFQRPGDRAVHLARRGMARGRTAPLTVRCVGSYRADPHWGPRTGDGNVGAESRPRIGALMRVTGTTGVEWDSGRRAAA